MIEEWKWSQLADLSSKELFEILLLRQNVFIVEQECVYPDIDEYDLSAWHLGGYRNGEPIAYLRAIPPGGDRLLPAIGRVLTRENYRRGGIGAALMLQGIERTRREFDGKDICISAQAHLQGFYTKLGFVASGGIYLEDAIPHIYMTLAHERTS